MTDADSPDEPTRAAIDWATAEVRDRSLKVAFADAPAKDWLERFEAVLARLDQPGHLWGQVRPSKRYVEVADVPAGHEAELRHLLEAAVQQTNADLSGQGARPDAEVSEIDQRMTDAFRGPPQAAPAAPTDP